MTETTDKPTRTVSLRTYFVGVAGLAAAIILLYALAHVVFPEPGPYEQQAQRIADECGIEVDPDTANWNALDRYQELEWGPDWYWYPTRYKAETGEFVVAYELENRQTGESLPAWEDILCADEVDQRG